MRHFGADGALNTKIYNNIIILYIFLDSKNRAPKAREFLKYIEYFIYFFKKYMKTVILNP